MYTSRMVAVTAPGSATRNSRAATPSSSNSLEHAGKYSIERLLALDEYCRTRSLWQVVGAIVWTPFVPVLIVLLYQLPVLAPPQAGWKNNSMYLVERMGLGAVVLHECFMTILRVLVPELRPVLPLPARLVYAAVYAAMFITGIVGFSVLWIFPVPFTLSTVGPIVGFVYIAAFYAIIVSPTVRDRREVWQRVMACYVYVAIVIFASVLYPAYIGLFVIVGKQTPSFQPLVALLAPAIKFALRRIMAYFVRNWEDAVPVMVIFSVEFLSSLYQAISVQTSNTLLTTAVIIALDVAIMARSTWKLYHRTNALHRLLQTTASDALLPVVVGLCCDPACLQASSSIGDLQQLATVRVYSTVKNDILTIESRARLEKIGKATVFSSSREQPTPPARRPCASTLSSVFSRLSILQRSATVAPDQSATSSIRGVPSAVILETTAVLFRTEQLLLTEFLECFVPFLYAINVATMWLSPNAPYYLTMAGIHTADQFRLALQSIFTLFALEVGSFVMLNVVLWKRLRLSPLHLLGFTLDSHAPLVRANMLIALIMASVFNLVHSGTDFSFQFAWLHTR